MTKSPCIGKCQLKPSSQLCEGCFRTMEEITNWSNYSDYQKLKLLKVLQERKNV